MAEVECTATDGTNDAWVVEQNPWAKGWRRVVFPGIFLAYLVAVAAAIAQYSHGPAEIIGFIALAAFCAVYVRAVTGTWEGRARPFWTLFAAGGVLFLIVLPLARANAFVMCIFLVVLLVALLGHSLTTITVKAELARKLGASDPAAAMTEIEEVEKLSRRALADVRAAVANYREVSLAGELATGRELLRAAGIAAELPRAVDGVDERAQELFGWVIREGITNVVRHSQATTCSVRLGPGSVEIVDYGLGAAGVTGNGGTGLSGLEERLGQAGGVLEAGPVGPRGWRVCARVAPQGAKV